MNTLSKTGANSMNASNIPAGIALVLIHGNTVMMNVQDVHLLHGSAVTQKREPKPEPERKPEAEQVAPPAPQAITPTAPAESVQTAAAKKQRIDWSRRVPVKFPAASLEMLHEYQAGETMEAIGKARGLSSTGVLYHIRRARNYLKAHGKKCSERVVSEKSMEIYQLSESGVPVTEIAQAYGISIGVVYYHITRAKKHAQQDGAK